MDEISLVKNVGREKEKIQELTGEGEPVELDSHVRTERHEKQCCKRRDPTTA